MGVPPPPGLKVLTGHDFGSQSVYISGIQISNHFSGIRFSNIPTISANLGQLVKRYDFKTDSTEHSAHKSSELLKNGLLTFEKKIAWKTCMVCLKFIDVIFFINNHLLIFTIELAWRSWPNSYTFPCYKNLKHVSVRR